jgi:uncharacterized 2Fe-2S/4Fe-4S cluster protein (DUF4445 family)
MRAADGAIEGVKIVDDEVQLQVIGDVEPRGLCGSGLVDAVAELVRVGLLDSSGRFVPDHVAAEIAPELALGPEVLRALAERFLPAADGPVVEDIACATPSHPATGSP